MSDIQVGEDQDPPEVGQWWVNEHGKRMHIAGKTADGTFVLEFPSGGVYRDHGNWMKCRQLEGCDSWDWLEFPNSPGDGYRFIDKKTDKKQLTDEFWLSSQQQWACVNSPSTWDQTSVYRRKVEPPAPVYQPENNDEWVELVDPEHILRRCVDEYFDDSVGINDWAPILASHGKPIKECQSLRKFRCRLKDLPQLPPAPTKIPVRLWVSERITYEPGSDWPVRCGENPPSGQGSWVEIHPSSDGFFVNKQS